MRPGNPPDHALEEDDLVAHALLDEDAAGVLVDDGLFVLLHVSITSSNTSNDVYHLHSQSLSPPSRPHPASLPRPWP